MENLALAPKKDFFGLGEAYWYFENCASLYDALNKMKEDWKDATGQLTREDKLEITAHFYTVLNDFINRHNAPWASEGIKETLIKQGYPVTQKEVLNSFLKELLPSDIQNLINQQEIKNIAKKISEGELFDSPYQGNFAGYDSEIIEQVLNDFIGKKKC